MICPECENKSICCNAELWEGEMPHQKGTYVCTECQRHSTFKIVEMDLVDCYQDTYNHKGEHVQIDLGKVWICPDCDHEEPFVEEENEDI